MKKNITEAEFLSSNSLESAIDVGWGRVDFDPDGTIVSLNDIFLQLVAYKRAEILGAHHSILCDPEYVKSSSYTKFWKDLRSGKIQKGEIKRFTKDGEEKWFLASYSPVLDKSGKVIKVIKISTDITTKKNLEFEVQGYLKTLENQKEELENSEMELRIYQAELAVASSDHEDNAALLKIKNEEVIEKNHILEQAKNALNAKASELEETLSEVKDLKFALDQSSIVATTDQKGVITFVNDKFCEISKYSRDELLGQDHKILNSGHHPKEFMKNLWKTIANGNVFRSEIKNKAKDGSYYWVDTVIVPFLKNGKPYQYIAIRNDITDRKDHETKILKVNTELDQFAYIVSHDLKAPLRAIDTLSTFIEDDLPEDIDEDIKSNFALLRQRTARMQNLIIDILEYSKIGKSNARNEKLDIIEVLKECLQLVDVPDKFIVSIPNDYYIFFGVRVYLTQVFSNIISNSIKYNNGEFGKLDITLEVLTDRIILCFKDDGIGIDSIYHKKVFEVFQTLSQKKDTNNTGIGLSTVKKIVEEMGGSITLDSALGKGSNFIIELPISNVVSQEK